MKQNNELNDEIDLRDLFFTLWDGKIYIILISIISVFLASFHLHSVERKYFVEYNLKPVGETKNNSSFSGLGGLASLAGIQTPTRSNNDFNIFRELITAPEVSKIIFKNKKIIKDIFRSEWDETLNNYSRPPKSKIQIFVSDAKKLLTGNIDVNYMPPNPRRLAIFINNNIQIDEDKDTGFLKFTSETSKPELLLSLIIEATKASDKIMRQRYVDFSTEPLAFYKDKLRTARSREHREALAELISKEEQKLMFASKGKHFIAEPYINPTISLHPTAPKFKLILALSLVLGLFLGTAFVLMRHAIKKDRV
ncbi:Wzz/FepE/Etk N-terminal domain-containing protein [Amylibacter sp.]|nr:Wzz/FepE/Etk N-terminal domain-containing protein [Amylibacter sp.]MDB2537317.1 Wzz/FepE/Etk N-terminal domain-containing protein [Amylibacter sp.]MDC1041458.1 Wzz/FepE/Etk N-terminal domain-containing protein [Amylibacter sp.]